MNRRKEERERERERGGGGGISAGKKMRSSFNLICFSPPDQYNSEHPVIGARIFDILIVGPQMTEEEVVIFQERETDRQTET